MDAFWWYSIIFHINKKLAIRISNVLFRWSFTGHPTWKDWNSRIGSEAIHSANVNDESFSALFVSKLNIIIEHSSVDPFSKGTNRKYQAIIVHQHGCVMLRILIRNHKLSLSAVGCQLHDMHGATVLLWQALRASQGHACDSQRVLWFVLPDVELCKGAIVPTAFTTPRSPLPFSCPLQPHLRQTMPQWNGVISLHLHFCTMRSPSAGCPVDPRSVQNRAGQV